MQENKKTRVIAVFAHNEARKIIACLESVRKDIRAGDTCVVLNNGSIDDTSALVLQFSHQHDFCKLVEISIGDKCNAWNVFIHELRVDADLFCFLDGDCEIVPGSLDALENCLESNPTANAVAALPASHVGANSRKVMVRIGGLAGNLYALSGSFVHRIREAHVKLPLGLVGDDSLIGALAYWDLNPKNTWDKTRIVLCEGAEFSYTPLSRFSFNDIRLYYKRKIRYSVRQFQNNLIMRPLKERGLTGIPRHADDLYLGRASEVRLTWSGVHTWFDWLAIRAIRNRIRDHSSERR